MASQIIETFYATIEKFIAIEKKIELFSLSFSGNDKEVYFTKFVRPTLGNNLTRSEERFTLPIDKAIEYLQFYITAYSGDDYVDDIGYDNDCQ